MIFFIIMGTGLFFLLMAIFATFLITKDSNDAAFTALFGGMILMFASIPLWFNGVDTLHKEELEKRYNIEVLDLFYTHENNNNYENAVKYLRGGRTCMAQRSETHDRRLINEDCDIKGELEEKEIPNG